ncbi:Gfo/Idh/MocA family oxidoreductase [Paenibacillus filicis]|uniref:Gfo/Idh/MocA family oxidoreductase n=1 Tax=Paenibacillus gyeongsangnamensis TaxID=3388067 RepID=A0ABT4QEV6_9BACL|nr:Gfo/Idh/MocA family oxidoreductase [Paenibacillus filicis]MCZ8515215.1 Gfo/Idh/MocA family oxidoreductase [Paenibacillus filicis]
MGKLKVGIIGTGGISHLHARQLLELADEVEITAIADTSASNREKFIAKFKLDDILQFQDYKDMLNQASLDAVVICSPHTLHFGQATDALNHGCHVLIEKPMTCSSQEAYELIETAELTGKVLQVSYQRHFQPEFVFIRQAIAEGKIGRLTSVTASLYQEWKQGTTGLWRQVPQLSGGGMLMDSGSHIVDVLLWTTGLTPAEVKSYLHNQGTPVEIDSFTSIRFEEGPVAGLNIVGFSPCWHETYVFCGEEGGIFYTDGRIAIRRKGQEPEIPELPKQTTNQDKSFIDAVLGRHEILVPGSFALKVVKLTEMIYQAGAYKPYELDVTGGAI